ncbi:MAG: beta-galactosidase, partial [Kiritimatiellae bacterium]|nr:beta-galactosidase [Kiritimatiellia bacterium]
MNKGKSIAAISVALCAAAFAGYKPAAAPIMTTWGEGITPENAWREYPRPQLVRAAWQNLNGLWDYAVTSKNGERPAEWQGQILVPFAIESALSGVGRLLEPTELLWYRRTFKSELPGNGRLLLHFGAVDFRAQVWVNNIEVTDVPHESGNLPFTIDITHAAKAGVNELVLSVWDPTTDGNQSVGKQHLKPHGCRYTRVSGIWQTVWLENVPAAYVTGYRTVTDIDKSSVAVTLTAEGNLMGATAVVEAMLNGVTLAKDEVKNWNAPVVLVLDKPQLWTPETPTLYDLRITLRAAGAEDVAMGYFGMRKIEQRTDDKGIPRFYLNNKKVFLSGTLDQGWWPDGLLTPPSEDAMIFDIMLLKECGFNMMRKHVKIEPLRYYYLCDKFGLMVFQDMVSGWKDGEDRSTLYRREFKGVLDLLQTIPSIVMWVPYNEGWGQPEKAKTNMVLDWAKRYDPTRLVSGPSGWKDHGVGDALDIHKYPGPDMPPVTPNRLAVLGEFGGIGLAIEGHLWAKGSSWGYVSDKTADESFARFTSLYDHLSKLVSKGLAAAVYTQTSDVEIEINGLVTYDRKHVKYSPAKIAKLNRLLYLALDRTIFEMLPTSQQQAQQWKYTFDPPAAGWEQAGFDDSSWKTGEAGFGNAKVQADNKEALARTLWETPAIWLRRTFDFENAAPYKAHLKIFYDEDTEVFLN